MSLIASLIGPVSGILDKVIPDSDMKAKLAHEIATMSDTHAQQALLSQLEINKAEAASGSLFKGGWRPFIGWTSGVAFAYHFVLQPLLVFVLTASGVDLPCQTLSFFLPRVIYSNVPIYSYYNYFSTFVIYNVVFTFLHKNHSPLALLLAYKPNHYTRDC